MNVFIERFDKEAILTAKGLSYVAIRLALFILYFWFGFLKVLGSSPANDLVEALLRETMPWIEPVVFITILGLYEMLIGALFLFPKLDRVVIPLLVTHLITTFGPFVFLPKIVWQELFVPTLEGQYIIKNLAIIALAIGIIAHMEPLKLSTKKKRRKKK